MGGGPRGDGKGRKVHPFPEVALSSRLKVHTLVNPLAKKLREALRAVNPNILYCQMELIEGEEVGPPSWGSVDLSDPESFCSLAELPVLNIIDTKDILFICGGAFIDLEKIISKRANSVVKILPLVLKHLFMETCGPVVASSDLVTYGLIPEFVGRFPILVRLSGLSKDQLVQAQSMHSILCCDVQKALYGNATSISYPLPLCRKSINVKWITKDNVIHIMAGLFRSRLKIWIYRWQYGFGLLAMVGKVMS